MLLIAPSLQVKEVQRPFCALPYMRDNLMRSSLYIFNPGARMFDQSLQGKTNNFLKMDIWNVIFFLLTTKVTGNQRNPIWTIIPEQNVVGNEDGSVTLRCGIQDVIVGDPVWYSYNRQTSVSSGSDILDCTTCSITDGSNGHYNLTINPAKAAEDEGNWRCQAGRANPQEYITNLVILDQSPSCEVEGNIFENKIVADNDVTFTCSLNKAAPPGDLVWMRNGIPVKNGERPLIWSTKITKSNKSDIYNCQYYYGDSSPSPNCEEDIHLDVQYPPLISLDKEGTTHDVRVGDEFTVICTVHDANPPAHVEWIRGTKNITRDGKLQLTNIEKDNDGGYKCKATNTYHNGDHGISYKTILLNVQYIPDSVIISHDYNGKVIENETLTTTCNAAAKPPASYIWINPTQNQVGTGDTLIIENIKRNMNGLYTCEASNIIGTAIADIDIDIQYPPVASVAILSGDNRGKIREGENFKAECAFTGGNPGGAVVSWSKGDSSLGTGGTLTFNEIDQSRSGSYKCTATNTYYNNYTGSDERMITIDVQYPPGPPHIYSLTNGIAIEGTTFNATCNGQNGNPSRYSYKWRNAINNLSDQQMLVVEDIQREQSGVYTCITVNNMYNLEGSASGTIHIDVQYLPTQVGDARYASEIGQSVVMKLTVDANPVPVSFSEWKFANTTLNKTDSQNSSSVYISDVEPEHFGSYNVSAENDVGIVNFVVLLQHTGPPEPPTINLLRQDYTNLTVQIIPGFHGGDEDSVRYTIEYRKSGNGPFKAWKSDTKTTVLDVINLQSGSMYEFTAYAKNQHGKSDTSQTYQFSTYGLPNITFNPETGLLSWTPHDNEKYYCVKIEMKESGNNGYWETIHDCIPRHVTEYTVTDKNAQYQVSYCTEKGICEDRVFQPITQIGRDVKGGIPEVTFIVIGVICAILILAIVVLAILIRRNYVEQRPKYLKESSISETIFDGVDNPDITHGDTRIHGGQSHERESTAKDGNPYLSDQNFLGKNSERKEATTSFAVYAAPNKVKKIQDYKHEETAYANVTKPGTQAEPPFFTNGTDHDASPYANVEEKNAQKKEVDTAYADVQTTETRKGKPPIGGKGKKPQRKGKKTKTDQADRPNDDVPDESKQQEISTKDVKPSSQPPENPYEVAAITMQKPKPQDANVEGLTYADLDFKGGAKGKPQKSKPPVKPIDDDAVAYAAVDFSKSGKPN